MSVAERSAPRPAPQAGSPAEPPVLVGTDGSGSATLAVCWAADEARMRGTTLRIVTVVEPGAATLDAEVLLDRARVVAALGQAPPGIDASLAFGRPADVLAEYGRSAQLTVVGHRGAGGLPSIALGSAAFRLARSCPSPLVVVRFAPGRPVPDRGRPIVVALDGSDADPAVLDHAAATAAARGARLDAVHVWTEHLTGAARRLGHRERRSGREDAERMLADTLAGVADRFPGLEASCSVVRGRPAWSLLELSDSAQLVVVGTRRPGVAGLCPSVLVQASGCPVAVVPVPRRRAVGITFDDQEVRR